MADYQITASRKDGADADRRLDAFRIGTSVYSIDTVIDWITSRVHRFYVSVQGRSVWVIVGIHPTTRRQYLTTQGDSFPPNNLLNLPNC